MKIFTFALSLILFFGIAGAGLSDDQGYEENALLEAFARRVFITVARKNLNAFIKLCVQPEDVFRNNKAIMYKSDIGSGKFTWKNQYEQRFEMLLKKIKDAGGIQTFKWVRVAKIAGLLDDETGFVGNMWVVVKIGGKQQILEIGATYMSKNRGRVLSGGDVNLISVSYYNKNYSNLPF